MYIYIDPRGTLFGSSPFCVPLLAPLVKSDIDHILRSYVGCVTGIYYQIRLVQEFLCTLLPTTNSSW